MSSSSSAFLTAFCAFSHFPPFFAPVSSFFSLVFGHVCPGCSVWPLLVNHPVHFPALQRPFPVLPFGIQAGQLVNIFVGFFSLRP